MKILALDTTAAVASVALCDDETLLGEITLNHGNTHSESLLPSIEFLLRRFPLTPKEIDLFAVSQGPGSFTGVRIGISTIKGLAFGTDTPCIGVSTLEALALNLCDTDGLVCPVMNARRQQVYTALFQVYNGRTERLMPDSAIALTELDERLKAYSAPVRLCGDGYDLAKNGLTHPTLRTSERYRHQSAYSVAQVALQHHRDGVRGTDLTLLPTYLRLSQAERERAARLGADTGI